MSFRKTQSVIKRNETIKEMCPSLVLTSMNCSAHVAKQGFSSADAITDSSVAETKLPK